MLKMEYNDGGGDALTTLANKNRATSKKIFEQLQQSARSPAHIAIAEGHMLHRQPSGAQKRIRQRQEQKWLKAVSANSANVDRNRAPPPPVPEKSAYRSLIDSGGYKSILPDEPPFTVTLPSVTPLPINTFACSVSSPVTVVHANNNINNNTSPTITGGKPTVQVHPMPSNLSATTTTTTTSGSIISPMLTTTTSSSSLLSSSTSLSSSAATVATANNNNNNITAGTDIVPEKIREKPAVPKKPAKLILSSTTVEAASITPLSLSTSSLNLFSPSAQPSPSTSGCNFRLFSTPSFMCLHTALMQPSLSDEEIERLDLKRKKLIESISRKVEILDEERAAIDKDFALNEELKNDVLNELLKSGGNPVILEKIEKNLAQNSQLCRLEARLRMQLERLQSLAQSNNENTDRELIAARIERLKRQLDDQTILRKAFDRRDTEVDKYVLSRLNDERGSQWRIYKDTWKRLTTERQEIDERLFLGREQINALRNAQPHV